MTKQPFTGRLVVAAAFALGALALMVWSVLDPRPMPVIVAMSVGQVLGTASFLGFLYVVFRDQQSAYRLGRMRAKAPAPSEKAPAPSKPEE